MKNRYLDITLKKNKHLFTETEMDLAKYFLQVDDSITRYTIAKISEETGYSQATIFKFVKKLGFSGFQDFKISVANHPNTFAEGSGFNNHLNMDLLDDVTPTDSPSQISRKVISSNIVSLNALISSIDEMPLENVIQLIEHAKSLHFMGAGGSSIVAYDSYHKFSRTNYRCNYIADAHMQLIYATKLGEGDCVFLFSHSGESIQILESARLLKKNGATVISMTGNPHSELVNISDECIIVYSQDTAFRTESLTSRILYLSVLDSIYVTLVSRHEEHSQETIQKVRHALSMVKHSS